MDEEQHTTVHSTPKAAHHTPLPKSTPMQSASPGGVNVRTPKMIQFGKFDITTWYSSPYPQVTTIIEFFILILPLNTSRM